MSPFWHRRKSTSFKKKDKNKAKLTSTKDPFTLYGYLGRLSTKRLNYYLNRLYLKPYEKEYVKRVMERFDKPSYSRGVTKEEFLKGLEEMAKNPRDPIDRQEVEKIKKYFKLA